MALTTMGMTGTVDQVGDAQRWAIMGPRWRTAGDSDLRPTVSTTTNLTVNIAAGTGMACGVFGTQTPATTIALAANSSGSVRIDALGMEFTWGNPGAVVFKSVTGASPSTPPVLTWTPGIKYQGLIGYMMVQNGVGLLGAADLYDMRVFGGIGGEFGISSNPSGNAEVAAVLQKYIDLPVNSVIRFSETGNKFRYAGYGIAYSPF